MTQSKTMTIRCGQCGEWFTGRENPWTKGPPRFCSRACYMTWRRGANNPVYKGEWTTTQSGYQRVYVWIDDEMRRRLGRSEQGHRRSYAARARINWLLAHPGETLAPRDVIHHKDGDTLNDAPDNLERLSPRSHRQTHTARGEHGGRPRTPDTECEVCGAPVRPWRRFCSRACSGKAHTGDANPNHGKPLEAAQAARRTQRTRPETVLCAVCGAPVKTRADRVVRFCSRACNAKGQAGPDNPNRGKPLSEARRRAISEAKRSKRSY